MATGLTAGELRSSSPEELVSKLLQDPALLQTLATTKKPEGEAS